MQPKELMATGLIGLIAAGSGILAIIYFVQSVIAYGILAIPFGGILFIPLGLLSYASAIVFFRRLRDMSNRHK